MSHNDSRRNFFRLAGLGAGAVLIGHTSLADVEAQGQKTSTLTLPEPDRLAIEQAQEPGFDAGPFSNKRAIGDDIVINAVDVELNSKNVSPINNLTIYADVVRLVGKVSLPGKKVFIHARRVVGGSGAEIDVSGADATGYAAGAPARSGINPGEDGTPGRNGADGSDGGSITIQAEAVVDRMLLTANGGRGSAGENGGNGATGSTGGDGPDRTLEGSQNTYGTNLGGKGGTGGKGGDAGSAGNGGSGGKA